MIALPARHPYISQLPSPPCLILATCSSLHAVLQWFFIPSVINLHVYALTDHNLFCHLLTSSIFPAPFHLSSFCVSSIDDEYESNLNGNNAPHLNQLIPQCPRTSRLVARLRRMMAISHTFNAGPMHRRPLPWVTWSRELHDPACLATSRTKQIWHSPAGVTVIKLGSPECSYGT